MQGVMVRQAHYDNSHPESLSRGIFYFSLDYLLLATYYLMFLMRGIDYEGEAFRETGMFKV